MTTYFLDTFTGSGNLAGHVADVGGTWTVNSSYPANSLQLVGGRLTPNAAVIGYTLHATSVPFPTNSFALEVSVRATNTNYAAFSLYKNGLNNSNQDLIVEIYLVNAGLEYKIQSGNQDNYALSVFGPSSLSTDFVFRVEVSNLGNGFANMTYKVNSAAVGVSTNVATSFFSGALALTYFNYGGSSTTTLDYLLMESITDPPPPASAFWTAIIGAAEEI